MAAGEAGAGALSLVPSWLLSGGLAALAAELAFAIFALFVILQAGGNAASEMVSDTVSNVSKDAEKKDVEEDANSEAKETAPAQESVQDLETEEEVKL